jgi:hypothetical protein
MNATSYADHFSLKTNNVCKELTVWEKGSHNWVTIYADVEQLKQLKEIVDDYLTTVCVEKSGEQK